jgi:hypothetical protein
VTEHRFQASRGDLSGISSGRRTVADMTTKLIAGTVVVGSLLAGIAMASSPEQKPVQLADATMIVEVNATDGDAGLQAFLDGEAWRTMTISGPDGRRVLSVEANGRLRRLGMTELFSESNEPTFAKLPLRRFLRRFPEGRYHFAGTTVDGRRLVGSARLSHDIPAGPKIVSPRADSTVPRAGAVAAWERVSGVVGYRAIVEREHPLRVFNVDLPASVTRVAIPPEFLQPGVRYKLEVQSIARSGNQTISELEFRVAAGA